MDSQQLAESKYFVSSKFTSLENISKKSIGGWLLLYLFGFTIYIIFTLGVIFYSFNFGVLEGFTLGDNLYLYSVVSLHSLYGLFSLFLIFKRKKAAIIHTIIFHMIAIMISIIVLTINSTPIYQFPLNWIMPIAIIIYFLKSKRVEDTLKK